MRQAIEDGLHEAKRHGGLRLEDGEIPLIANYVLASLGSQKSPVPPTPVVLPEATPVTLVGTADMVALIAKSSQRMAPKFDPMDDTTQRMSDDWEAETRLAWSIQSIFGVWCFSWPRGSATHMKLAGRQSDMNAFRMVLDALLEAGRPQVATMDFGPERRAVFWKTLGALVAGSDRAKAQIATAKIRTEAAHQHANMQFGMPAKAEEVHVAANGTDVYAAATRTLAEVAL